MQFSDLGLRAELLRSLTEQGYDTPTPIQQQAIPVVLGGHDLMAAAQTGTGKTAGFALPILQLLSERDKGLSMARFKSRVLILTPTRELCAQVFDNVRSYAKHLPLKSASVFGGVSMHGQSKALRAGVDIIVATPGRLLDHVNERNADLSQIEIVVLDEADRMLDMGFLPDMKKIFRLLPQKRQTLLFSATFSDEIRALAGSFMQQPQQVDVAPRNTTAETVKQSVYHVARARKRELLEKLITDKGWHQVLVFTRTKHGANALAEKLDRNGIKAAAIHGNKSQNARTKALADFKSLKLHVLVATDIAARGIDIDQLPFVVNYELPNVPADYVHRIGRTGRAGASGEAVSLVCVDEYKLQRDIERLIKRPLEKCNEPGFEPGADERPQPLQKPRQARPSRPARQPGSAGARPAAAAPRSKGQPGSARPTANAGRGTGRGAGQSANRSSGHNANGNSARRPSAGQSSSRPR